MRCRRAVARAVDGGAPLPSGRLALLRLFFFLLLCCCCAAAAARPRRPPSAPLTPDGPSLGDLSRRLGARLAEGGGRAQRARALRGGNGGALLPERAVGYCRPWGLDGPPTRPRYGLH